MTREDLAQIVCDALWGPREIAHRNDEVKDAGFRVADALLAVIPGVAQASTEPAAWAPWHPDHGFDIAAVRKKRRSCERYISEGHLTGWSPAPLYASQPPAAPVEFDSLSGARKQAMESHASMLPRSSAATGDEPDSRLPLQYEDGPDYCTVKDAQGRDFALTMQPELMQAMERALREDISRLSRPPVTPIEPQTSAATEPLMDAGSIFTYLRERMADETSDSLAIACRALADHLRVLRDVPQTLGQWQPIDTAPREPDAMFMVCAVGDARGPFVVRSDILWRAREAGTPSHLGLDYLTHWMPLPEMPQ